MESGRWRQISAYPRSSDHARKFRTPEVPAKFRTGSGLHRRFAPLSSTPEAADTGDGSSGAWKFRPPRKFRVTEVPARFRRGSGLHREIARKVQFLWVPRKLPGPRPDIPVPGSSGHPRKFRPEQRLGTRIFRSM